MGSKYHISVKKVKSRFESPSASPGYQLWLVSNVWQRRMRSALKEFDLTHVQFVLLAVTSQLCQTNPDANQVQIARAAGIDKMMASQVLRSLEEKGLVTRTPDEADSRAIRVGLTEAGVARTALAMQSVEQTDVAFFGALGEDAPILADLLHRLVAAST
jgi:DNA-binding MarR family transcriptional regulator